MIDLVSTQSRGGKILVSGSLQLFLLAGEPKDTKTFKIKWQSYLHIIHFSEESSGERPKDAAQEQVLLFSKLKSMLKATQSSSDCEHGLCSNSGTDKKSFYQQHLFVELVLPIGIGSQLLSCQFFLGESNLITSLFTTCSWSTPPSAVRYVPGIAFIT